jgi:5-formyltetrahydrofolate cyclo-ligase
MTAPHGPSSSTDLPASAPAAAAATGDAERGRAAMRRDLRARRRALPAAQRAAAALAVARHLAASGWLRPGLRLAAYLALPEAIDVSTCIALALRRGAALWLPRIEAPDSGRMVFAPAGGALRLNAYGIPEPATCARLDARWMQLVLVPLVAFDEHGARLGMGGGFYDRALAWRRWRSAWMGPRLVGIAHSSQRVGRIAALPHDVRLDAVITEQGLTRFRKDPR